MRNRKSSRILVLVLSLLGILFIVASCDTTSTPTPETAAVDCTSPSQEEREFPTGAYFVGQQVILSGPQAGVTQVAASFQDRLEPLRECSVAAQVEERQPDEEIRSLLRAPERGAPGSERVYQRSPLTGDEPYALHLYEITDGTPVAELVQEINRSASDTAVYADPNYVTGHLANSACGAEGRPFSVEGSPFSVEGSPFSVEGSAPNGGLGVDAAEEDFRNQQAFSMIEAIVFPEREHTGEGVRVGVFDTSPFASPNEARNFGPSLAPPLALQQVELGSLRRLQQHVSVDDAVKEHGLFVTGLIHTLAPESDYYLYRVLDDRGCGDLFGLVEGLHLFMAEVSGPAGSLDNVVINMSMGVLQPRDAGEGVAVLEAAVLEAFERGAVLVAAAGNDSVGADHRLPAELPAAYQEVIGAAAVNNQVAPTCYSNRGDVAAPAGEADLQGELGSEDDPLHCEPRAYTCTQAADGPACWWGVISLATVSDSGYAYWVGTSFAAPLVSGLAAAADQGMVQGDVYGAIMGNAVDIGAPDFAAGMINVSGALP